ncbi:OPT family oligopeptide transporter [Clostridium thermarum]|uniref:OPT family oligopeptide transporter n=1 Tax=Clostridium thermarum TaxID=1716543 RepID=UPI0011241CB0|nr:oligopeptide transporter, OPT family [Clostridium thermarum]
MSEKRGLSHNAYGGIHGDDYVPYVPVSEAMPEMTAVSLIIGAVFGIIFAAANTYLGLKVGLTISAGIPAAILATGILKGFFGRNNILEANLIQGIAAMGESIAGGIIFTMPAIIIWGMNLSLSTIFFVTILGGLLGILFVVPLRRYLLVEEHGKLIFPESMAAAEVLVTGSAGGTGFKTVMTGLLGGALYKLLSGGLRFWGEEPEWVVKPMQNTIFGFDTLASLLGVGFIVGTEVALYMFGGSFIAWFALIPLIKYFGSGLAEPLFPSEVLITEMGAWDIWSKYIRYVGAGAVAAGGFISLARSLPTIINSFRTAIGGLGDKSSSKKRTELDVPMTWVLIGAILVFLLSWFLPMINAGFVGALMIIVFSFFFSVVSGRMVGIIGASNNPVSGMTIATLLFATSILRSIGLAGDEGMLIAITIGGVICVAIAVAGGAAQSMKTGFIIGGTPKYMQIGMYIGLVAASLFAGLVLLVMHDTYGIGSREVAAPQATLMSMVVKGVMTGDLPWALVLIGGVFGIFCALARLPILPVALGIYLPIHLNAAVLVGGIIRTIAEKKFKNNEEQSKLQIEKGILLASGIVAGDAIMGIVVAVFAAFAIDIAIGSRLIPTIAAEPLTATIAFFLFGLWMYFYTVKKDRV